MDGVPRGVIGGGIGGTVTRPSSGPVRGGTGGIVGGRTRRAVLVAPQRSRATWDGRRPAVVHPKTV
jgi:hypothetical protein